MKKLLNKEIIFLKNSKGRFLFVCALIMVITIFVIVDKANGKSELEFIFSLISSTFIINIIFDSVMLEKKNKSFEKIFQLNNLKEIIRAKSIIAFLTATFIAFLIGSLVIVIKEYSFNDYYSLFLLIPFLNLVFSKSFCLILILTDQVVVTQIVSMIFAVSYIILMTSVKGNILIFSLIIMATILFYGLDVLINKVKVEKMV